MKKIKWPVEIKTKRLILRTYRNQDFLVWKQGMTQRLPKQHVHDNEPLLPRKATVSRFIKMKTRQNKAAKKDKFYVLAAFEKKTGKHIGVVDILTIARDWYQWANLGYFVHNNYQGQGYGTELARAGLKLAFENLGFKRVEAAIYPNNPISIKIVKKLGMKKEGLKKEYIFDQGVWQDHLVFSKLNPKKSKRNFLLR